MNPAPYGPRGPLVVCGQLSGDVGLGADDEHVDGVFGS
jgi:hypothetical protein